LSKYESNDFENQFPLTAAYLRKFSTELSKRDCDKSAKWFEYGRSQALAHLNQSKLLISTLITGQVRVYDLNQNTIPYSGIYITQAGQRPLSEAKRILMSQQFYKYIRSVGIQANGTSIRISVSDINNYTYFESPD
jgi:hypothetical protein